MQPYTNLNNLTSSARAALDKRFWRNLRFLRGRLVTIQEGTDLLAGARRAGDAKLMVRELDRLMYDCLEAAHYAKGVVAAARGHGDTDVCDAADAPYENDPEAGGGGCP